MLSLQILVPVFIFIILQILIIVRNLNNKDYQLFFYLCDFIPLIFIITFLFNFYPLAKSLISIGLIPQLIGIIPPILNLTSNIKFDGIPDYGKQSKFNQIIELLIHLVPINLALLLTYQIKPEPISLFYSFIILIFLFISTITFTSKKFNINFVYGLDFLGFKLPWHTLLWVIYAFIIVVLPGFLVQYLVYVKFS